MATDPGRGEGDVPVQPAASVLVIADRRSLEVLLLHRRPESEFVGGMVVFPGGAVDESDLSVESRRLVSGEIGAAVEGTGLGPGHVVAGVRETLEEVGLWLGSSPRGPLGARRAIDSGERLLSEVAEPASVPGDRILHAGRFVTPAGAPRRYDTHFFVTRADADGAELDGLEPDGREVIGLEWADPAEALDRIALDELSAMEPTVIFLEALARYRSTGEVIATARRRVLIDHGYGWTVI